MFEGDANRAVLYSIRMRVLQIGADRSRRGILVPDTAAYRRQKAYAEQFGALDIVGFSLEADGFQAIRDGALHVHPTNSRAKLLYGLGALSIAAKLQKPDVVSTQDPFETGLVGLLISRLRGLQLHVQVHTDFLSPEYARLSTANRIRRKMAYVVLRGASRVRVVSQRIKESIQREYNLRVPITVLPIYADIDNFRSAEPDVELAAKIAAFKTKLLVVSRLEAEKNVALAVEAFAQEAPEDSCLVIVGDGSERTRLESLCAQLNIASRVFFEPARTPAHVYPIADLVLVTSRYEGYGLVIIEALAAGKPVLSTDVGIAREAGAIVAEESEYAEALKKWFVSGPRGGTLVSYPHHTFEEYVSKYCDDVASAAG